MADNLPEINEVDWNTTFQPVLEPGEIHIWKVCLDGWLERIENFFEILSDSETLQAKRFRFDFLKIRYATTHASLRLILAKYLGIAPGEIKFLAGPGGKPGLEPGSQTLQKLLYFNISHSDEMLLVALSAQSEIGVDLEKIKPEFQHAQVSKHFFATREQTWIAEFPPELQNIAFYRLWTCKEAVLKGEGSGMRRDLEIVKIVFEDGMGMAHCLLPGSSNNDQPWNIRLFVPAPGYTAALAYHFDASAAVRPSFKFYEWKG
jgi:4'-phosphopantetheinyl transferase